MWDDAQRDGRPAEYVGGNLTSFVPPSVLEQNLWEQTA